MIKILQVVPRMNVGGLENFIMNMYRELNKQDVQFDFICFNEENEKCDFDDEIKSLGGTIYHLGMINYKHLYRFYKKFKKVIKENGPYQALHVHSFYNCGIISLFAKLADQKNIITHSHTTVDNIGEKEKNKLFRKIYVKICKHLIKKYASQKLACGEDAGKALYDKDNFIVVNNGIKTDKFLNITQQDKDNLKGELKNKYDFPLNKEDLIITHAGHFVDVKNHEFIIKIAKRLKDKNIKFKMVLLGKGELEKKTQELINNNELNAHVRMVGLRNDVEKFLLISDVFILPSKYEGYPVSLIEAQCARFIMYSFRQNR